MSFLALRSVDWTLLAATLVLSAFGLVTMNSFVEPNTFFEQQLVWLCISLAVFFFAGLIDWRFLRNTPVVVTLFLISIASLALLFFLGTITKGAVSRFDFGAFFLQPSDPAKLVLVILLAKYFSRRHVEIAHVRHILVSGFYALIFFVLLFIQPDFGGAIVVFFLWLGMVLVSGISKKHLALVFLIGALAFGGLWGFVFQDYQKDRIRTFIHPLTDIQGAGYNAYQSTITVGSGEFLGKGVGFGTQSRLQFLPEYETDFIFGAFAEEWGFVGILLLLLCFGVVVWRILREAFLGATNFETLFAIGVALTLAAPAIIHIGMNVGLLPVTGTVLPFVSYGGSHLVIEFLSLGILSGMRRYRRATHRDVFGDEVVMQ
ncbi:MAG: rod shape-determining protein RodA [Candidatus Campbellbacteria bacterium]|nr:rod shape-determining protein RodA [Candidatus Campbellbacteria bacterium]